VPSRGAKLRRISCETGSLPALGMTLLAACSSSTAPPGGGAGESFERYSYGNEAGTRSYKVFVPAGLGPGAPLVVELHGCGGDADEEARWSRFNTLAAERGFLVAYPEQDPAANCSQCWNWFLPEHQERDAGEPSLIAGITREVTARWQADPARVYVGGISAGGAMSAVMAATYPDLYAAAMVYAGCEYKGTTCTGAVAAVPPETAGQWAYEASGAAARVVPVIVIQGDLDVQVPFPNADIVVQQFLAMGDWADNGVNDGSLPREPSATASGSEDGGHTWEIDDYTDDAGCLLAQRWLVHGMAHAWSDGESDGSARDDLFTDPAGPDVTTPIVEFFLSHPMPPAGRTQCTQHGN
jgi:poly(hydroxyalkanoate) depolymerase family esterase